MVLPEDCFECAYASLPGIEALPELVVGQLALLPDVEETAAVRSGDNQWEVKHATIQRHGTFVIAGVPEPSQLFGDSSRSSRTNSRMSLISNQKSQDKRLEVWWPGTYSLSAVRGSSLVIAVTLATWRGDSPSGRGASHELRPYRQRPPARGRGSPRGGAWGCDLRLKRTFPHQTYPSS